MARRKFKPIPKERALIKFEEPAKISTAVVETEVAEIEWPKQFSILSLTKKDKLEDIPKAPHPYFIASKNEMFLYKPTLFGHGIIPTKTFPPNLAEVEKDDRNFFWFLGPIIPAPIVAQIVHFFRRIYETYKTEAEVILLLHRTTKEYRVWIPSQRVTGTSVDSRYEPEDLPAGYSVVGSMHSHCEMGAFHSGTDIGDAEEFDGVHLTLGHILSKEMPDIDAMIMMNKVKFTVETEFVADFSNLKADTAPEWWDEFVRPVSHAEKPRGFELFAKYPKVAATPTYSYTPPRPFWESPYNNQQPYVPKKWQPTPKPKNWPPGHQERTSNGLIEVTNSDTGLTERFDPRVGRWVKEAPKTFIDPLFDDNELFEHYFRERYGWSDKDNAWVDWGSADRYKVGDIDIIGLSDDLLDATLESNMFQDTELDAITEDAQPLYKLRTISMAKIFKLKELLETLGMDVSEITVKMKSGKEN